MFKKLTDKVEDLNEDENLNNLEEVEDKEKALNVYSESSSEEDEITEAEFINLKEVKLYEDEKVLSTKIQIAKNLLVKQANKQFIMEITGFELKDIEEIEKKL